MPAAGHRLEERVVPRWINQQSVPKARNAAPARGGGGQYERCSVASCACPNNQQPEIHAPRTIATAAPRRARRVIWSVGSAPVLADAADVDASPPSTKADTRASVSLDKQAEPV